MNKKIIILNGSPRANGNTKKLIEHFTAGAETAGNEVISFDLQKMNIWTYVNTLDKKSRKIMQLFLVPHPPFAVVSNNQ